MIKRFQSLLKGGGKSWSGKIWTNRKWALNDKLLDLCRYLMRIAGSPANLIRGPIVKPLMSPLPIYRTRNKSLTPCWPLKSNCKKRVLALASLAVRSKRVRKRGVSVHRVGEAQVDFGYALDTVSGVLRKTGFFVTVLPYSDTSRAQSF